MSVYFFGEPPFAVSLEVSQTAGRGICAFVSGGTSPHVGGVAIAVPRPRSDGRGLTCDMSQICIPGHKDVHAAAEAAKMIALATEQVVSVTAGLHVDDATDEQIRQLMTNVSEVVKLFLGDYSKQPC